MGVGQNRLPFSFLAERQQNPSGVLESAVQIPEQMVHGFRDCNHPAEFSCLLPERKHGTTNIPVKIVTIHKCQRGREVHASEPHADSGNQHRKEIDNAQETRYKQPARFC